VCLCVFGKETDGRILRVNLSWSPT